MLSNNEGVIKKKIIHNKNLKQIHKPYQKSLFHQVKHIDKNNNIYICNCLFLKRFYNEENNDYIEPKAENIKINDLHYFKVLVNKYPKEITNIDYIKDFYIDMKFIRENDICYISYNGQRFNYDIINILYKHTFNNPDEDITKEQYNNSYNGRLYAYFLDYNYPKKIIENEIKEQLHKINQYNNLDYNINQTKNNINCLDKKNKCNLLKFSTKIPKIFIPKSIITSIIPIDIFIECNKEIIINQNEETEENEEEKIIKQITLYAQLIIMSNGLMFIDLNDEELLNLPYDYIIKYFDIPAFTISYNPSLPEPTKKTFEYYLNKTSKYYNLINN